MKHKPIIPWMGGKRRLAKHILPIFPEHTAYCEPFCGGAASYFYKEPSKVEVLNDFNGELVNLYRVVKHHLEEFIRHFKWALMSRQEFLLNKNTDPTVLTDIQRASRFYYLQKLCFGGMSANPSFGVSTVSPPRFNLLRIEEDLSQAHFRLSRTYIENLSWEKCIEKYDRPGTLFYCDPPYFGTTGYGNDFTLDQYDVMAELARNISGKMIISVNDIPEMRKAFDGLHMKELKTTYTNSASKKHKPANELLITNF